MNDIKSEKWSIVIPCHNKADWIVDAVLAAAETLKATLGGSIVVVENGSTDHTLSTLKSLPSEVDGIPIRIICLAESGLGRSFHAGIREVPEDCDWIVLWSADLPFGTSDLRAFVDHRQSTKERQIRIASKLHPQSQVTRTPLRSLMTWSHKNLRRVLFNSKIGDSQATQCFPADVLRQAAPQVRSNGFFFRAELLLICERWKIPFVEVPVNLRLPESPTTVRFFRDSARYLKELILLRIRLHQLSAPAQLSNAKHCIS